MRDPACSARTSFIAADVFTHPFAPASFDLVTSNAMLHHVDAEPGLRRMRELVRPGGVVAIVGFAMPSDPLDRALITAGFVYASSRKLTGRYWEHDAPKTWPATLLDRRNAISCRARTPRRPLPADAWPTAIPSSGTHQRRPVLPPGADRLTGGWVTTITRRGTWAALQREFPRRRLVTGRVLSSALARDVAGSQRPIGRSRHVVLTTSETWILTLRADGRVAQTRSRARCGPGGSCTSMPSPTRTTPPSTTTPMIPARRINAPSPSR